MNCEMGSHIRPEGWHNWGKQSNEQTARYSEYNNHGAGAATKARVAWSRQLTKKEAAKYFYTLLRSPRGQKAYQYFKKRELSDETMQKFGLGYSGQ